MILNGPWRLLQQRGWPPAGRRSLLGKVRGRVIGPGRAELAAAVRSPPVVMSLALGQNGPEMCLQELPPVLRTARFSRVSAPFQDHPAS
jgi:hypothetical protein